jgi:Domain of unknown function (DUF5666)/Domain of unknown function (DUF4382)
MRRLTFGLFLMVIAALATLSGCGGSSSPTAQQKSGTVVMTGQDSPIPSVLSFQVTIDSITLGTGISNGTVMGAQSVLSTPSTVDFARFVGLRTLLGLQSVPPGTYTVAQIVLENPVISVLNLGPPATVSTQTLPFSAGGSTVTLNLALNPGMTVSANGLGGVTMHFDLRNSLVTDTNGDITSVNPVITFRALQVPSDPDWEIDELRGTVVSVSAPNSFVLQRVGGRQFTIDVNGQTDFEGVASSITNLTAGTLVEVSGQAQQDGSILADAVESYTTDREFLGGIVLNVTPSSGQANSLTLLVRDQIPVVTGISVGNTANVAIDSNTVFDIYHLDIPISSLLFNRSMLVLGQAVGVGGTVDNSSAPPTLDARRIVLHRQGIDGHAVQGSINLNAGTFQLQNDGFWGYLLGAPLNVLTTPRTNYFNVSGLDAITPAMQLRVVGLLLRDGSGNPVLVAKRIENLP